MGSPLFSQLADGSADHEFRRQDALAEGHARMMQAFQQHLHAGFADFLFVYAPLLSFPRDTDAVMAKFCFS